MRRRHIAAALAALTLTGAAAATAQGATEPAPGTRDVVLGLARGAAPLERFLAQVSDPSSPDYREYATVAQLRSRFGATPRTVRAVRTALARRGVHATLDPTGSFVVAPMTGVQIRALFGGGGKAALERAGGDPAGAPAALPADLRGHVTEVIGLSAPAIAPAHAVRHRSIRELRRLEGIELPARTGRAAGCEAGREVPVPLPSQLASLYAGTRPFTPNQFRTAFGFDALHRAGVQGQGTHIALFELDGGVNPSDVRTFAECFGMPVPRVRTFAVGRDTPIAPVDGGATLEATLDVQAVMTAAPRARIDIVQGDGERTTMAQVLSAALDARRLGGVPDVVSVSYGVCEPLWDATGEAGGQGPAGRRLFDHVARIAGAAGVSVTVASGDSGSSGCAHNVPFVPVVPEALSALIPVGGQAVAYPATSPAVTAVGGTSMTLTARNTIASQRPWNDTAFGLQPIETQAVDGVELAFFPTGGGTGGSSRLYAQPFFQRAAGLTSGRRTVPDVAMYADSFPGISVYCTAWDAAAGRGPCPPNPASGAFWSPVGGTSFAAPLLAGGIALANQYARSQGAPPLGFLNPLLYDPPTRKAGVFDDVTRGSNAILPVGCCSAARGYDQATGWGTVDVTRLARAAQRAFEVRPT